MGEHVATLGWDRLSPPVQSRTPLLLLDAVGCAAAGVRLNPYPDFVGAILRAEGPRQASLWFQAEMTPAPHAALVNASLAHHVEMDDGNPRASLHGGVSVVPAAVAVAETTGASGRELLISIVAGYDAAVACGRKLLRGIEDHRLHPPSMVGCFGAAAAASRLWGLSAQEIANALALAGTFLPMGPFEAFTKGAPVKDLYGGWPAMLGVHAALLAREGLAGPHQVL
ncbi:MAG: MmgE/PrpD family protein, partial [Acidobacteriota bacterium]